MHQSAPVRPDNHRQGRTGAETGTKNTEFWTDAENIDGEAQKGKAQKSASAKVFRGTANGKLQNYREPRMGNCRIGPQTAENFSEIFDASFYTQVMVAQRNAPGGCWTLISPSICMDSDM